MVTQASSAPKSGPQTTAIAKREFSFANIDELERLAKMLFAAGICPRGVGRPETAAAIILMGREVGLAPVQALQSIMVVQGKQGGGRMSMWGDALLALVRGSGQLLKIDERIEGQGDDRTAVCIVHRKGEEKERVFTYSLADARRAGLYGNGPDGKPVKLGPWVDNPDRQLTMRARSFALRDVFTDVLCGLTTAEEAIDDGPQVVVRPHSEDQPPATTVATQSTADAPVLTQLPTVAPPAARLPAAAFPNSPTIAAAQQPVDGELMITEEQLREIAAHRDGYLFQKHFVTPNQKQGYDAAWKETLAAYGVESARKLTHAQADDLLAKVMPF